MIKHTFKNTIIDIVIISFIGAFNAYFLFLAFLFNGEASACGESYLNNYEDIQSEINFFIFLLVIEIILAVILFLKRTIFFAICIWLLPISIMLNLQTNPEYFYDESYYYEEFNKQQWDSTDEKPIKMIRTIIKEEKFIGKTKDEIESIYGKGKSSWTVQDDEISYDTDGYATDLTLKLNNGTVIEYSLDCYD